MTLGNFKKSFHQSQRHFGSRLDFNFSLFFSTNFASLLPKLGVVSLFGKSTHMGQIAQEVGHWNIKPEYWVQVLVRSFLFFDLTDLTIFGGFKFGGKNTCCYFL